MNSKTRLKRLEEKAGGSVVKGLVVLREGEEENAMVSFCEPGNLKGERIPLKEFQAQFPDAELTVIRFCHRTTSGSVVLT